VILTGGLNDATRVREVFELTGATAVMLARGCLGNPWLFRELLDDREHTPSRQEIVAELYWVIEQAVEHLGADRATRYLRKFYPWYVTRLEPRRAIAKSLQESLQSAQTLELVRGLLAREALGAPLPV